MTLICRRALHRGSASVPVTRVCQQKARKEPMEKPICGCPYEPLHAMQMNNVREDIHEVKERVGRLEATLARGVLLLLANLIGVSITLAQQLLAR